ncbi:hypothetical protein [Streptosporangium sp. NPDC020145]|uniref:hypothetical protein n=1 Tax=Streptosporangium sp. NPDC020145 TaxID=3154694 RepID=UPI003431F116
MTNRVTELYNEELLRGGSPLAEIDLHDEERFPYLAGIDRRYLNRPVFVGEGELNRFADDVVRAVDILMSLPERLYDGDLDRLCRTLGVEPRRARLMRRLGGARPYRFGRIDAYHDGESFKILEFNATSETGGLEWVGPATRAMLDHDALRAFAERHRLGFVDAPEKVAEALREAGAAVTGGRDPVVALIEGEGGLADYGVAWRPLHRLLRDLGLDCRLGEITDLDFGNGRVLFRGTPVDVVYRVFEVDQVVDHPEGLRLTERLLAAHEKGSVVVWTPLETEIYRQKACMTLLSDPGLGVRLSAEERALIDRVLPWTRSLGEPGLFEECVERRERLILKPNDAYSGRGIVAGWEVGEREWLRALRDGAETGAIVQERVVPRHEPVVDPVTGRVEPWEACWGLYYTPAGGYAGGGCRFQKVGQVDIRALGPGTKTKVAGVLTYPDAVEGVGSW